NVGPLVVGVLEPATQETEFFRNGGGIVLGPGGPVMAGGTPSAGVISPTGQRMFTILATGLLTSNLDVATGRFLPTAFNADANLGASDNLIIVRGTPAQEPRRSQDPQNVFRFIAIDRDTSGGTNTGRIFVGSRNDALAVQPPPVFDVLDLQNGPFLGNEICTDPTGNLLYIPNITDGAVSFVNLANVPAGGMMIDGSQAVVMNGAGAVVWRRAALNVNVLNGLVCFQNRIFTSDFNNQVRSADIMADGTLAEVAGSPFALTSTAPFGLTVDPRGRFLALMSGAGPNNQVQLLTINQATGAVTETSALNVGPGRFPQGLAASLLDSLIMTEIEAGTLVTSIAVDPNTFALTQENPRQFVDNSATANFNRNIVAPFYVDALGF
ncbi:MAG: hypothetical protein AB1758_23090, partial [Candidatus Eremiobacterota bacterium]